MSVFEFSLQVCCLVSSSWDAESPQSLSWGWTPSWKLLGLKSACYVNLCSVLELYWSDQLFFSICLFTEGCLQPIYWWWSIAGVMVLHYRFIWPQPGLEHLLNCASPVAVKAKWSTGDDDASTQPGRAVVLTDWLDGWLAFNPCLYHVTTWGD